MSVIDQTTTTPDAIAHAETPAAEPVAQRRPASAFLREIIETLLLTFFIFWIVNGLVGRYRIDGNSMNPTLLNGEYLIISNFAYQLDEPERGDIIVFRHPRSELNLIKRVIGLPGDHVTCCTTAGQVSVNGVAITESYVKAGDSPGGGRADFDIVVPAGKVWVMGDHRSDSADSRLHDDGTGAKGAVPMADIHGKAVLVVWPLDRWAGLSLTTDVFAQVPAAGPAGP